ncbi:hypothetical protein GCM10007049_39130 [Echinicola pacifica]|uniref:HTH araC/xylS-type domain-containing protein n=2 Tax=Echinicola pacifica TaxID=346377 RepID=A0A918QCK4_9BACT|nr:hypothetical protein GCM10007049_39130 [Echinicola pacifica]
MNIGKLPAPKALGGTHPKISLLLLNMKNRYLFYGLCIVLAGLASDLWAQNLKFKTYLVEDGLSNNSVNKIVNAQDGGLWIATWDGLNYFDGKRFTVFRNVPGDSSSLPGNFITDILLDQEGQMWVRSSEETLSLKGAKGFTNFSLGSNIQRLGLSQYGQAMAQVRDSILSFEGNKWAYCKTCSFTEPESEGLNALLERQVPGVDILDQHTDRSGRIWYATLRHGVYVLSPDSGNEFYSYHHDATDAYSIRSNEIYTINEDVYGNIWLGTKDGGISMAHRNSSAVYSVYPHPEKQPQLPNETLRALTQDQSGQLWLGFYNSGLFLRKADSPLFKRFDLLQDDSSSDWNRIRSLYTDRAGTVWVGTYAGVLRISAQGKKTFFTQKDTPHFVADRNYDFFEDKANNCLWVACWGGLSKYSYLSESFEAFEDQRLFQGLHIRQVLSTRSGLFVATERNGVAMYEAGKLTFLDDSNGLLNNSVFALQEDEQTGNIWIATLAGVSVYHPMQGMITHIRQEEGLRSQLVYGLLPDEQHMWISTTNGISRINLKDYTLHNLAPDEGWQGAEFSEGAFFRSELGMMFFGGVNGLNYFHPQRIELEDELPRLSLLLPDTEEQLSGLNAGEIELGVRAVQFSRSDQNQVQFRLLPASEQWREVPSDGRIIFEGLSPGSYTLEVRNSLESRPENYLRHSILIPRPIWHSPFLWVALMMLASAALILWRTKAAKNEQKILQRKIEERTALIQQQKAELQQINDRLDAKNKEINEQKSALLDLHQRHQDADFEMDKFKAYVLGQFKMPLTDLKENLELLRAHSKAGKETVMGLVEQMLTQVRDWEKIQKMEQLESGGPSLTLLPELMESIFQNFQNPLTKYHISFREEYQLTGGWVELDVLKFKLFWQYLLREVLKYLESGAAFEVKAHSANAALQVDLTINSSLLVHNLEEILRYSPYLKSAFSLLESLSGKITYRQEGGQLLMVQLTIPYQELASPDQPLHVRHWKHLNLEEQLAPDKHHIVLLGKKYESDSLVNIIHNEEFEIIVEEEVQMVISAIKNASIDALIIYNEKMTGTILELVEAVSRKAKEKVEIPVFYVYDTVEVGFQEKLIDMGVENFIQLPASSRFILKKIGAQIDKIKRLNAERNIFSLLPTEDSTYASPNEKLVKEGLQIIRDHLADGNFKVEQLSEQMGISKIKCYRGFKEVLGTSPSDLLVSLRLEKAQKLLLQQKMNISEVSFACGYNDPKYFSKLFKKHLGQSPKHFQHPVEL